MTLYESISSRTAETKDLMALIRICETDYMKYKSNTEEIYSQIIELCPSINEDVNHDLLDYLDYLYTYVSVADVDPVEVIEKVLISKGFKDKTKDFEKLKELIIALITVDEY